MIKRLSVAAATMALCTGGLIALPAMAQAADPPCSGGYACMWEDIHYVTNGSATHSFSMYYYVKNFAVSGSRYAGTSLPVYKSISSEFNAGYGGDRVYYFKEANCTGTSFSTAPGNGDSDFTNGSPAGAFNDQIVSASFASMLASCF